MYLSFQPAPVLLLTGPAGVGKTTALRVLAKELKCQIQEWVNPITATINADSTTVSHSGNILFILLNVCPF